MTSRGSTHGSPTSAAVADPANLEGGDWSLAEVAERLGIATATLRTWDRRFGLGPSAGTTDQPRYDSQDLARLEVMRALTLDGVAPVDAAQTALAAGSDERLEADDGDGDAADLDALAAGGTVRELGADAAMESDDPFHLDRPGVEPGDDGAAEVAAPAEPVPAQRPMLRAIPGGDQGFARPKAKPADVSTSTRVVAIIDAALGYDQTGCNNLLRLGPGESPVDWWTKVVEPAWARIAERTVLGTPGEAPELVLASAALGALREFTREYELSQVAIGNPPVHHPSRMRKLVLIFAPIDEDIPLAAHALAAALVSQGATARVVTGPASPHRAVELVTMVRPAALVLATALARPDLGIVAAVHEAFPELPLLVSLQRDDSLPDLPLAPSVQRVRSFAALVHEVLAIVA